MALDSLLLLAGLVLIIKGGDWFVAASIRIAELLRMPRVVIGSTLVSLATTSPEMVVSVMSGLKKASGLAVGNAVGSCVCNVGLILGVMAAVKHIDVHPRTLRTPLTAMFSCGALLFLLTLDLVVSRSQGLLLITIGAGYFIYDFIRHKHHPGPGEAVEAAQIKSEITASQPWLRTTSGTMVQFLVGAAIVVFGSKLLVDSAVNVAGRLGVPNIIIGLTVVAVGTSLPELITAITSSRQNVSDLAVGNILGANIANLTLIVGTASSVHQVTLSRFTQLFNFPALLILMAVLLVMILSERRVTRREGATLLALYGIYIGALVIFTLAGAR